MNRVIKFRAWDAVDKCFYYFTIGEGSYIFTTGDAYNKLCLNGVKFEQFTGLHDKNGKEIYEGDILSFAGNMTADDSFGVEPNGYIYDEENTHPVCWNDKLAGWEPSFAPDEEWKYKRDTRGLMCSGNCEVIGNIHESPEVVK